MSDYKPPFAVRDKIKKRYNRNAPVFQRMDHMMKPSWREKLLEKCSGDVLEIGIGTGINIPYYPSSVTSLTGVDFSPRMLKYARKAVAKHSFPVKLMEEDAENLPFASESFDVVVTTCVFCSVPDPVQGLNEIHRVLKPGGQLLMLEHMRSETKLLGKFMDIINPAAVRLSGANINRRTMDNLEQASFVCEREKHLLHDIVRELHCKKKEDTDGSI
ncbi:class I SAM-dependent methyltransferase [Salisediminibacterium halotolerans]|uniref:Methyltransferase domain-containing protein n=1 Tax=Salisediminibacterium halotolerans TaxID=517425 RepID=A0A1H9SM78_9BACI|nr:class I SAM-dependent methyltransferase [Salisediminibacterium haloalkalitolerans]SER86024.1 Methyltransferase domain-containing protein [Salisediminibacterium haloalkalitolerans]